VRFFSAEPVPQHLIDLAIETASSAPSGANMQPWTFVVVRDPETKRKIRQAAEREERINYSGRMSPEWLRALEPLGTDWRKEFLEIAPALIVVFRQDYHVEDGERVKHYYVTESVGIATGFLITALNVSGLATLTHTPSPMGFLSKILERPEWERPFLLIPVGYPAEGCTVPNLRKKPLDEVRILR
ncbi:MAG: nitroreductase family protein, partial [Acidobacteria bacterium]|nr:nitroreductase family protein [Acidobacteriota bacterium]